MAQQVEGKEPGPIDLMIEAATKRNPRRFNRKEMKQIRKKYRKWKRIIRIFSGMGKRLRTAA